MTMKSIDPKAIDQELDKLYSRDFILLQEIAAIDKYHPTDLRGELAAKRDALAAERRTVAGRIRELDAIYLRYRWTRAFIVPGGHVHRSTDCHTCYPSTMFGWLVDLSGDTEDDIVALAGDRACTVCYPSAPVDVLKRPSQLQHPDEAEKAARAAERAEKAAAKERRRCELALMPDGRPLVLENGGRKDRVETTRAAMILLTDHYEDGSWSTSRPRLVRADLETLTNAIAARLGVTPEAVTEKAKANARKRGR